VIVMAETATLPDEIDEAAAEQTRREAEKEMADLSSHDPEFAIVEARLEEPVAMINLHRGMGARGSQLVVGGDVSPNDQRTTTKMEHWLELFAHTALRRAADTAHDLKTPLNVAVLNLELLKIRLAKLMQEPDAKVTGYAASIEAELRRMARIF